MQQHLQFSPSHFPIIPLHIFKAKCKKPFPKKSLYIYRYRQHFNFRTISHISYTPMSQNIATQLIRCSSSMCCQNSAGLPWHGLYKTPWRFLVMLAPKHQQQILQRLQFAKRSCCGSNLLRNFPHMVIWRAGQQLKLFKIVFKPFLNNICSVADWIMLLNEATSIWEDDCYEGMYLVCNYIQVGSYSSNCCPTVYIAQRSTNVKDNALTTFHFFKDQFLCQL